MKIRAYAKLNLALNIIGTKGEMHLIDTVMGSVSLFDTLEVIEAAAVSVSCDVPIGGKNVAQTAADAVQAACGKCLCVRIEKGIPIGGGMGGSSADGAAVLFAADVLFGLSKLVDLNALALPIGADVPYMLRGGFCRASGFGEILQPLSVDFNALLLIAECGSVNTGKCYKLSDTHPRSTACLDGVICGLNEQRLPGLSNALTDAAIELNPKIATAMSIFNAHGGAAHMTGSGGCIFGIYNEAAKIALESKGYACHKATFVPRGVEIISDR